MSSTHLVLQLWYKYLNQILYTFCLIKIIFQGIERKEPNTCYYIISFWPNISMNIYT